MIFPNGKHPYQICFCGYSGSGKTTLLSRLITKMSLKYEVGYIKTDAHHFSMDTPGKDTHTAWTNGASQVAISDCSHSALISSQQNTTGFNLNFLNCDIVFIEGRKESGFGKIIVVDRECKILDKVQDNVVGNVLAYVGQENRNSLLGKPYFHRSNIEDIGCFIEKLSFTQTPILYGLVLAGGFSQRMKRDKALIEYFGKTQVRHCFELLSDKCHKAFVSVRSGQLPESESSLPQINDRFLNFGPVGGILTAMMKFPEAAWLVVACDLPLLTVETLKNLISKRNQFKVATHYCANNSERLPEPLCAIYEPKARYYLLQWLGQNIYCPRKILEAAPCQAIPVEDKDVLKNINDSDEYQELKKTIAEENLF